MAASLLATASLSQAATKDKALCYYNLEEAQRTAAYQSDRDEILNKMAQNYSLIMDETNQRVILELSNINQELNRKLQRLVGTQLSCITGHFE